MNSHSSAPELTLSPAVENEKSGGGKPKEKLGKIILHKKVINPESSSDAVVEYEIAGNSGASQCEDCRSTSDLLQCIRCDSLWCHQCLQLPEAKYKIIKSSPELHWYCSTCQEPAIQAVQTDKLIEDRCKFYMSSLKNEISDIRDKMSQKADLKEVDELQKQMADKADAQVVCNLQLQLQSKASKEQLQAVGEEVKTLGKCLQGVLTTGKGCTKQSQEDLPMTATETSPKRKTVIKLSVTEMEDRERRKSNLVIFGLKESGTDRKTSQEQDRVTFEKLCRDLKEVVEVKNSFRLGSKSDNKIRPLKVTLESESCRNKILLRSKHLRDFKQYEGLYIKRDMTPLEREEDKQLREERDSRRKEDEKKGIRDKIWVIRNGKTIRIRRKSSSTLPQQQISTQQQAEEIHEEEPSKPVEN